MPTRPSTAATPSRYSLSGLTIAANGGVEVLYLNRARTTFFGTKVGAGSARNILCRSTDGGASWTDIQTTALPANNYNITNMVELPSGEVLITTSDGQNGATNYVYKSTGWASNPSSATWSQKHQLIGGRVYSRAFHDQCLGTNGVFVLLECDQQTVSNSIASAGTGYPTTMTAAPQSGSATFIVNVDPATGAVRRFAVDSGGTGHSPTSGTFDAVLSGVGGGSGAQLQYTVVGGVVSNANTIKARRMWLSQDFGETWTMVYDLLTSNAYKGGPGVHWHGCCYDEENDRIWATYGDNTGSGNLLKPSLTGYTQVIYSDDRGATWNWLAAETYFPNTGSGTDPQYTPVRRAKYAILFGGDAMRAAGTVLLGKSGYRQFAGQMFGNVVWGANHVEGTLRSAWSADNSLPIFSAYASQNDNYEAVLNIISPDGYRYEELWRETDFATRPQTGTHYIEEPFGPDMNGRICANYRLTAGNQLFRGVLSGY